MTIPLPPKDELAAPVRATPGPLGAVVAGGVALLVLTEALSAARALTAAGVVVGWASLGLLAAAWRRQRAGGASRPTTGAGRPPALGPSDRLLLAGVVAVGALLALLALSAAPGNLDSMTYHLPRVMHWAQERTVAFYPTNVARQLYLGPFAEMAVLHLVLPAGSDRPANVVQLAAWALSLVAVASLARRLGGGQRARVAAVVAAATLPMGLLQATSTQNDLVAGLWLLLAVAHLPQEGEPGGSWLGAGAALGLGVLTKSTVALLALPFVVRALVTSARRRPSEAIRGAAVLAAVPLLLVLPHALRNLATFGSPLGPREGGPGEAPVAAYANEAIGPRVAVSNVLRGAAVHLATPVHSANDAVVRAVRAAHDGMAISTEDPRTTWPGTRFALPFAAHEDFVGNPLHLVLFGAAIAAFLLRRPSRHATAWPYAACLLSAALLFSVALRWQPWISRLQLPAFLLAAPLAGVFLERLARGRLATPVGALLLLAALPFALRNYTRPLVGRGNVFATERWTQYFVSRPELAAPYAEALRAATAGGCRSIGLAISENDLEYPFWALAGATGPRPAFHHVDVANATARLASPPVCAVLATRPVGRAAPAEPATRLRVVREFEGVAVLAP